MKEKRFYAGRVGDKLGRLSSAMSASYRAVFKELQAAAHQQGKQIEYLDGPSFERLLDGVLAEWERK